MNKLNIKLEKWLLIPIYGIFILSLFMGFRSCSTTKENKKLRNEVTKLTTQVDSLKVDMQTIFAIEGYEVSKRMLYDQNAIIRTVVRPDDRMNYYDVKMAELRKKLK